ncbi:hypothetical protein LTR91_011969 [Friedmanniomyces endolithicus]|uniref:Bromodomain associated domain-containing protein n=2 Tax=Friedmanniomyces endolithicus TaxID=329885 RepID=A0AAN6KGR6_9PEZI|nr:hypothetical protein LTR94_005362 [Friedmanniomyces endolithicus]KAK0911568.1 hypothetical protein LTR57_015275 [Friedmanniomyces endolithicus]KAK0960875.1 hypothetical protein LTS01_020687 [Friedmanniomyces endolithicus]KAK0981388.1 hypothetical protein LTR91_011969 [Friedmanniomyces endolithicus]KAK1026668.1 hypothetical protein LTS16_022157 [Friedmanniomyces endolithicus]
MSHQPPDLHRALLRPPILHLLRAAGFHSTKPSVLDTLTNLAERHLLLLAATTARYADLNHNDPVPTVTDLRMALAECGSLIPVESATEEVWREELRVPLPEMERKAASGGLLMGGGGGGEARVRAEKRKRDEQDVRDVVGFTGWFEGREHAEARRVAGMGGEGEGVVGVVGVAGGVVRAEDFLVGLRRKMGKGGEEGRLVGTVLGGWAEGKRMCVEGGPVGRIGEWRPRGDERGVEVLGKGVEVEKEGSESGTEPGDLPAPAPEPALEEVAAA